MRKRTLLLMGMLVFPFGLQAQNSTLLDSIVVSAAIAGNKSPITYTRLGTVALSKTSPTLQLPFALDMTPGVVALSENGTGTGYSHIRIRGSDASRINVTLNGISLNDAESQEVFWVNLPALTGFLEQVQVQRGVGSSTAGPGAFGGSIHLQTKKAAKEAYGTVDVSLGSYQTYMTALGAGTGARYLRRGGEKGLSSSVSKGDGIDCNIAQGVFSLDLRYAHNQTQGYIRNGKAQMHSLFTRASYTRGRHAFKLNWIYGTQSAGITWEGISREMLIQDRRSNPAGAYSDAAGNLHYYDNETDNYTQNHLQFFYLFSPLPQLHWTTTLNYSRGDGYYENYKQNRKFSDYSLGPQELDGVQHSRSDLVQQARMGNNNYVLSSYIDWMPREWRLQAGANYALYQGDHLGRLIWAMYNQNIAPNYQWYENNSNKQDASAFLKLQRDFGQSLTAFADFQYRYVHYRLEGPDKDGVLLDHQDNYHFVNPKIGLNWNVSDQHRLSFNFAVGQKEPSRSDFKEAIKADRANELLPERMFDWELGYNYTQPKGGLGLNLYWMDYQNQLVSTGKLTETGYVIKENVTGSHRAGVEFVAGWSPVHYVRMDGNISLSINRIKSYTAWVDYYDNPDNWNQLPQKQESYTQAPLAYSPACVAMGRIELNPWKEATFSLKGKYVGKQYYDNTGNADRSLPAYFTLGAGFHQHFLFKKQTGVDIRLFIDNLLNEKYVANAWLYRAAFADGSPDYLEEGFFPQATANFTLSLSLHF